MMIQTWKFILKFNEQFKSFIRQVVRRLEDQLAAYQFPSRPSPLKIKLVHLGNATLVIVAFTGVAVMIDSPLRNELTNMIISSPVEVASLDSLDNQDMETADTVKMVSLNTSPIVPSVPKVSPEIIKAKVPSIAPLASQIQGPIDPAAFDNQLLSNASSQQKVANFMANKYSLDITEINRYISQAVAVAKEVELDPVLLVAVMSIESNFNPFAQSNAGAQGLMQVLTRLHADKYAPYGGRMAAFKPEANIRVGAYILKYYIAQAGSLSGGLRSYVGGLVVGDGGYVGKVLREREQLNALLRSNEPTQSLEASNSFFMKILPSSMRQESTVFTPSGPQTLELPKGSDQDS